MIKVLKTNNITPSRKNLKRKISFGEKTILPILILAIFLAPISAGIKTDKNDNLVLGIQVNEAKAFDWKTASLKNIFGKWSKILAIDPSNVNSKSATFSGEIIVDSNYREFSTEAGKGTFLKIYIEGDFPTPEKAIHFIIKDESGKVVGSKTWDELGAYTGQSSGFSKSNPANPFTINTLAITTNPLTPGKTYTVSITIDDKRSLLLLGPAVGSYSFGSAEDTPVSFTTTTANPNEPTLSTLNNAKAAYGEGELNLGCTNFTSLSLPTCVAQLSYIIWSVSAAVTTVAATFLDFFVYYSTNSSSYNNDFVRQGWGAVRDIANIFFIIALLYVAIKTILGLNVTNNKKLIGAVIVVALVINFSLFATQIVIDGSNILAKVFYNNITSVDKNGTVLAADVGGQKSISIGLVDKFNPQSLITQPIYNENKYTFIFMTLIIAGVLLYMTYIFFSVALLFVARVVSLWMSMIFSPLAFASFTVPFDMGGMGHTKWWKDLIEDAFLAPIFIFFLYIIVLFTKFLTGIIKYADSPNLNGYENTIQHLMSVIIPFAIIVMLLTKAKQIAVEYSGKMGAALTKIGSMVGGVALGAGAGAAAFGLRNTAGRVAANLAESERFRNFAAEHPKFGGGLLKATNGIGAGSFDVRGIKVGGKGLADTGLTNLGKAQAGGFAGARAAAVKKQEEFANKMLDTSDKGKAELTRGGMTHEEAITLTRRMGRGGMNALDQARHYRSLMGGGIATRDVSGVARYLDAAKRETYADRIENRSRNRLTGIFGPAERTSAKKRISANKIRKDFGALSTQANMNQVLANLAAAGGSPVAPAAPAPAAPHHP